MTHDPLIGTLVADKYRVESLIARGGMGAVYRAVQEPLGRPVALKVLASHRASEAEWAVDEARFFREASVASKLTHPNTVVIHDYGAMEAHRGYFLVMEFLEGKTLAQVLADSGPLPPERLIHIAKQIASSLAEAHKAGVVHRDLKPANVILIDRAEDPDFVKIVDFGLVRAIDEAPENRVTEEGTVMGSPLYISPEQIMDMDVDHRADVYALGCVLYEMASGRPPYIQAPEERGIGGIMRGHLLLEPPPMAQARPGLEVSAELEAIARRCLHKQPDARYQSMAELYRALDAVWLPPRRQGRPEEVPEETFEMDLDALREQAELSAERAARAAPKPLGTAKLQRRVPPAAPGAPPASGPGTGRLPRLPGAAPTGAPAVAAGAEGAPRVPRLRWLALGVGLLVLGAAAAWFFAVREAPPDRPVGETTRAPGGRPEAPEGSVHRSAPSPSETGPHAAPAAALSTLPSSGRQGASAASPAPSDAGASPSPTAPTRGDASPRVQVTIDSTPPGAKVFDIEDLVGRTPLTLDVDRDSLPRSYRLVKRGYVRATAEVPEPHDRSAVTVTVPLHRRPAPGRARPVPRQPPPASPGGGIKLTR